MQQGVKETGLTKMISALEGSNRAGTLPVVFPYMDLYADDRIDEELRRLYGKLIDESGQVELHLSPEVDIRVRQEVYESLYTPNGFDIDWRQVHLGPSRDWYQDTVFRKVNGRVVAESKSRNKPMALTRFRVYEESYELSDWDLLDAQTMSLDQILDQVEIKETAEIVRSGATDLVKAEVEMHSDYLNYCSMATPFSSLDTYLGFAGTMRLIKEDPQFLHELMARLHLQKKQVLEAFAKAGARAVWIIETGCSSDLISPAHYEDLALPYESQMVSLVQSLGMHAIVYFCGNSGPLSDLLKSLKADAYALEEGRKGYELDMADIAASFEDGCVLGNIDTIWDVLRASDERLEKAIAHQVEHGRRARSFVISAGSPFPPETPIERVRQFVEIARRYSMP